MKSFVLFLALICSSFLTLANDSDIARWQKQASEVTITRDTWGIPHVYGKTDANAVFGMIYAQAEDDFNRIEVNYLNAMGRLAEAEGESELYRDLRMQIYIDPVDMKQKFSQSPAYLQTLMRAWADGLNYYLHTHPEVQPRVITKFEPWMALTFTEGSIGGDIESISINGLESFYGNDKSSEQLVALTQDPNAEPRGSNGFAIAPQNTKNGNALLLINPHTSFYFRAEMHMRSDEGLNAYGAVTWGQFFIYQGFNENTGWMHTSSGADFIDEFLETVEKRKDAYYYKHGDVWKPLRQREISLAYKTDQGQKTRTFTVYYSHRGPIVRELDGKWISVALMQNPIDALKQSYGRTKTTNYDDYRENMRLHTNSSNNTLFADSEGNIAYFHSNFIPRRDPSFDWKKPVDGSNPATDWQGLHTLEETVHGYNPKSGYLNNTNNWPWMMAGPKYSPKAEDYPPYMENFPENYRGIHAIEVLDGKKDFTIDSLAAAAYSPRLTAFDVLLPVLYQAYEAEPVAELAPQIALLKGWDHRSSVDSTATSLAIIWGQKLRSKAADNQARRSEAEEKGLSFDQYIAEYTAEIGVATLQEAKEQLIADFGSAETPWGEINRFQRLTGDIVQPFDDDEPSIPVGFASARWGSLAAYGQRTFNGTKRIYGTRGNSFVAVVEFGDKVKAKAITAGGQSGDPASPHFNDQAPLYAAGKLRDVYFYPEDIEKNTVRKYHPGE
ncbi:penicillin acylase family protein [Glaciecola sp. XM2]|jgi:acyl-homoserine-lactone acylase|uniref:penicillin acylase family protein n=1 Tax=Glaciecola sp. XM2 TaxID=1914931 RepID=UPI001BDF24AE|nr:penicillin acylase family protein [Glaciecola sp. XM2]MBT1449289.1 penicillin acylase family protein [Glaciecola sp. XM2]